MLSSISSQSYKHLKNLQILVLTDLQIYSSDLTVHTVYSSVEQWSLFHGRCLKTSSCSYCSSKNCWLFSLERHKCNSLPLFHAFINKKDCLICSLCTDCIFNANQFTNLSQVKMKPEFIKVDEGSLIPCSQGSDALSRVRRGPEEDRKNFLKWFTLKYSNSH